MDKVIEIKNLTKVFKNGRGITDINLDIHRSEIFGFLGPNGAGKTTAMKIMTGLTKPDSGDVKILGFSILEQFEKAMAKVGCIIETAESYPYMTAYENLKQFSRYYEGVDNKRIEEVLELTGILKYKNENSRKFSLGMKQRLGLALALMGEPEFLILDEPINGLDPTGIIEIRNLLLKLNREKNITILISSHILTELSNIATTYGFLDKGILIEQITAEKLSEKCNTYLDISVTDTKKYCALLETKLSCDNYKVMPENHIRIFDINKKMEDYSSLAVLNGIGLLSMEEKRIDLENYYMNLIESVNE